MEITSNGTTKITPDTGYNGLAQVNVKVNVEGGSGGSTDDELKRNDVNFFDYDGTLLYSYSWDEAKELTKLPALPVHDGLEVREWNYTLEDIREQGTENTIGKADVGACVYDGEGEQMLGSNVLIIERGETTLPYYYDKILAVVSIPNTITTGSAPSITYCTLFGEVKIPISFKATNLHNYSLISDCCVDSIYINGDPSYGDGYWYNCFFRNIYRPQDSFTEEGGLGVDVTSPYIKMLPHIQYISAISFRYRYSVSEYTIIDFSEYTYVPELGYSTEMSSPDTVIVPDELYDEWVVATNWSVIADRIRPASEYKNIIME